MPLTDHPLCRRALCGLLLILSASLAPAAGPATLVHETFADGNRTGQTGPAPLTSLDWRLAPTGTRQSVADGAWSIRPYSNTVALAHFPAVSLPVGASLSITFRYRHAADLERAPFRVVVGSANGALLTGDLPNATPPAFLSYTGYFAFAALGSAPRDNDFTVRKNAGGSANFFGQAECVHLEKSGMTRPPSTRPGELQTGVITIRHEAANRVRVDATLGDSANGGVDATTTPLTRFDTFGLFFTKELEAFDLAELKIVTNGEFAPSEPAPAPPAPRVLRIDRRGGADFTSIAQAVSSGLRPGDTLQLVPGSGPYREEVYIAQSGTPEAPIVLDGAGETVTGFEPLADPVAKDGAITFDLTPYWTSRTKPQGFNQVDGRWRQDRLPADAAQPLPFVLSYRGERVPQSATVRTTPPPGSPAGALGRLGQLTAHATLSDDGNTLTLLPGVSPEGWEISTRHFVLRIYNASHQTYRNLKLSGSLNDGVNLHGDGRGLVFEKIEAFHNLDEGFSAHETISCAIRGGVFYGNDNGLVNINHSTLEASDLVVRDNLGFGVVFTHEASARLSNVTSSRNGVLGLGVRDRASVTLANFVIVESGWRQKPWVSCNESANLPNYTNLRVDESAGALIRGDKPAIRWEP